MSESSRAAWPEFRPTQLLEALAGAGVDFVVIGGIAAVARGSARLTQDLDITYSQEPSNLKTLAKARSALDVRLRGMADDVPLVPDERTLRHASVLTLDTSAGPLDLLTEPAGAPSYPQLRKDADRITVGGISVLVASIDHLVAMKLAAGGAKDIADVEELDAIRRLSG